MIARQLIADRFLELVERFHARNLGEIIVDFDLARRFDRLRGNVKGGFLAGELFRQVVVREAHIDHAVFTSLHADELFLEARNERLGTDVDADVLARAAFERHAVELAGE